MGERRFAEMNVASLENCKRLYELSGWVDHLEANDDGLEPIPEYSLGYLLRKLPLRVKDEYQGNLFGVRMKQTNGSGWIMWYGEIGKDTEMYFTTANTPEDAACRLLINLIEEKVISV